MRIHEDRSHCVTQVLYIIQQLQIDECSSADMQDGIILLLWAASSRDTILQLRTFVQLDIRPHWHLVSDRSVNPEMHFKILSHLDLKDLLKTAFINTYLHSQ